MTKRILVTGHQGYLGPIVTAALKQRGFRVRGVDCGFFRKGWLTADTQVDEEVSLDLRDLQAEHLEGVDGVVHLAGLSNDPLGELDPLLTEEINTQASFRLAELARAAGVERFVFASSCSVYGAATQFEVPLDESAPCNPVSAYAVSKRDVEQKLQALASDGFSPVMLRFATAYGMSPHLRLDIVLNNLMACAFLTGDIRILSDGTPWRPLVHVQDMAQAICAGLTAPQEAIHNQVFNIGRNDANYQVKDIAETVSRHVAGSKLMIMGQPGGDNRSYRVNFDKALKGLPGFAPSWTIEKGSAELLEAFTRNGLPQDALQSPLFIRLKRLQALCAGHELSPSLRWAA